MQTELIKDPLRQGHLGGIAFGRHHLRSKPCGESRYVARRGTRHQHLVGVPYFGRLQHLRRHRRLDQETLRFPLRQIEVHIEIRQRLPIFGHKGLAWDGQHRLENPGVGNVGRTHLAIDHVLARLRKTGHRRTLQAVRRCRGGTLTRDISGTKFAQTQRRSRRRALTPATVNKPLLNPRGGYSIVTPRRPIILAASSRLTASCCSTARASRIKHSSSLIGETSVRAKGAVVRRSVWMSGMKSPLARPALPRSQRIKSFQRSLCAQSAARVRRLRPAIPPRSAAAELLLWQQVPPFSALNGVHIWSFARRDGFVIRWRARTRFSPIPR